eukprot:SAG25_NODE_2770_length_1393_cov_1.479134_1_plen_199_part_00
MSRLTRPVFGDRACSTKRCVQLHSVEAEGVELAFLCKGERISSECLMAGDGCCGRAQEFADHHPVSGPTGPAQSARVLGLPGAQRAELSVTDAHAHTHTRTHTSTGTAIPGQAISLRGSHSHSSSSLLGVLRGGLSDLLLLLLLLLLPYQDMLEVGRIKGTDGKLDIPWNRAHFGAHFALVAGCALSWKASCLVLCCG